MNKLLYIETVGCQMNVLDSELVVASLRQRGYDMTSDAAKPTRSLFNTCSVRSTPKTRSTARWAGCAAQAAISRQSDRRHGLHGPKRPAQIFRAGAVRRPGGRPGPAAPDPDLIERSQAARPADGSQPGAQGRLASIKSNAATRASTRSVTRRCGPRRGRPTCGSRSAATSSAPTASCPVRGPEQGRHPTTSWPRPGAGRSRLLGTHLLGKPSTAIAFVERQTTTLADLLYRLHDIEGSSG